MFSRQLSQKSKSITNHSIWRSSATAKASVKDGYVITSSLKQPSIPALGFGTWGVGSFSNEQMAQAVDVALKMGYRHLDCARVYGNEKEIGQVIADNLKDGTVKREDLFVTSKVFNHEWNTAS